MDFDLDKTMLIIQSSTKLSEARGNLRDLEYKIEITKLEIKYLNDKLTELKGK
jgi:hypothetical protein